MNEICETIVCARSEISGKVFPVALLSGDTDMATAGWLALSSTTENVAVLAYLTASEWKAAQDGSAGYAAVEKRVNQALARSDLKCCEFLGVQGAASPRPGQPFQAFRREYQPPKLRFKDLMLSTGEAVEVSRLSVGEFKQAGGQLLFCAEVQPTLQADGPAFGGPAA